MKDISTMLRDVAHDEYTKTAGEVEARLVAAVLHGKDLVVGRHTTFDGVGTMTVHLMFAEVERGVAEVPSFPRDYYPVTRYFTSKVGVA